MAPAALAALAVLAAASGCGGGGNGGGRPTVVASTGVAADIVSHVAGGDAEVVQLVPDGAVPHSYAPSAREQQELADADLLVYFSPRVEEALPLDLASRRFAIADHVDAGGGEGSADPHVWLDPTLIANALPDLADALAAVDPGHARAYERRAAAYAKRLHALDRQVGRITSAVPPANRKLVTSHELLGHFADRYGFEFVGAPFGLSPESEASAASLDELIKRVEAEKVPAIFAQEGDDPEVLRQVAAAAGARVVADLYVESFGDGVHSYATMMRDTATKISAALGG